MMRITIRFAVGIIAAVATFLAWRAIQWSRTAPTLVIARDTTFLTSPMRADGTVDYVAAWCAEHGAGVTAENNAVPLLLVALGEELDRFPPAEREAAPAIEHPFLWEGDWGEQHAELLGGRESDGAAEQGDDDEAAADAEEIIERVRTALDDGRDPGAGLPILRAWLASNQEALALATRAMEREGWYAPSNGPFLSNAGFRWNPLAFALRDRASVAALDGEFASATSDLRASLRMARRAADQDLLIDWLQSISVQRIAWRGARAIARGRGGIEREEFVALAAERDPLPLEQRLRRLLQWERVGELHYLGSVLAGGEGLPDLAVELGAKLGVLPPKLAQRAQATARARQREAAAEFRALDRNRIFRRMNTLWDQIDATLLGGGGWIARLDALAAWSNESKAQATTRSVPEWFLGPDRVADAIATTMVGMASGSMLRGVVSRSLQTLADAEIAFAELAALAFATEQHRDPTSTDELTPSLLATPFRDRVTGSSLSFRRDEQGELRAFGPAVDLANELREREERTRRR